MIFTVAWFTTLMLERAKTNAKNTITMTVTNVGVGMKPPYMFGCLAVRRSDGTDEQMSALEGHNANLRIGRDDGIIRRAGEPVLPVDNDASRAVFVVHSLGHDADLSDKGVHVHF